MKSYIAFEATSNKTDYLCKVQYKLVYKHINFCKYIPLKRFTCCRNILECRPFLLLKENVRVHRAAQKAGFIVLQ